MHVTEPMHAVLMLVVQYQMMQGLLGTAWGKWHFSYLAGIALCMLAAQKPRGGVMEERWGYACMVLPTYFAGFLLIPALSAPIACILAFWVLVILKVGVCMSVCLHRYASHQAFKCGPCTAFFIHYVGCLANQGGALWWASNHRCHHKFCDVDRRTNEDPNHGDPHSPILDGPVNAFAFFGGPTHAALKEEFCPRHCDGLAYRLLDTFAAVPTCLEMYLFHAVFGAQGLWVCCMGNWFSQAVTLWFNVLNHMPDTPHAEQMAAGAVCKASNGTNYDVYPNTFFRLLNQMQFVAGMCGEDSHEHHHTHGGLAWRPGVDIPYWLFVRPLQALGLIWNVETKGRSNAFFSQQ
jgi:fatty-acid desaturase